MPEPNTLRAALVELAAASEFTVEMERGSPRFRAALDAAWALVDPDGSVRRAERMAQGCSVCGAPVGLVDGEPDDLCEVCWCGGIKPCGLCTFSRGAIADRAYAWRAGWEEGAGGGGKPGTYVAKKLYMAKCKVCGLGPSSRAYKQSLQDNFVAGWKARLEQDSANDGGGEP